MTGPTRGSSGSGSPTGRPGIARDFDRVAGVYDTTDAIFSGPIAERLVEAAGIRPGDRVLDIGCGTGAGLLRAATASLPGGRAAGMDLSVPMLAGARAKARDAGLPGVALWAGAAENPPCADARFDAVIASLVFYLLPRPGETAARWLRVLRPGGTAAISWNVREDPAWEPVYAAADRRVPDGVPTFTQMLRHWPLTSVGELEQMLAERGYTDISTVTGIVPVRYPAPELWWDSGWTRARRIAWQHIPAAERPAVRADCLRLLEELRDPADGSVTRNPLFGWTTARRRG